MKVLIYIVILLLAVPVGLLIRKLAKEEVVLGRKWIMRLFIFSSELFIFSIFYLPIYLTSMFAFMAIVCLMSLIRIKDKYKR